MSLSYAHRRIGFGHKRQKTERLQIKRANRILDQIFRLCGCVLKKQGLLLFSSLMLVYIYCSAEHYSYWKFHQILEACSGSHPSNPAGQRTSFFDSSSCLPLKSLGLCKLFKMFQTAAFEYCFASSTARYNSMLKRLYSTSIRINNRQAFFVV